MKQITTYNSNDPKLTIENEKILGLTIDEEYIDNDVYIFNLYRILEMANRLGVFHRHWEKHRKETVREPIEKIEV